MRSTGVPEAGLLARIVPTRARPTIGGIVTGVRRHLVEELALVDELVVIDSALHDDVEPIEWQERVLNDGSRWEVYKRYFEPDALAEELGGGETLHAGRWFVAVRS